MTNPQTKNLPLLDKALLRTVASLEDDDAIVTVLAARGTASATHIRATLRREGSALNALAEEAAALADPRLDGAAHGLVACLSTGETHPFQLPRPVPTLITIASHADVVPIARAFDAARPVGIIDARLDRVRVVEAAHGKTGELEGVELEITGDWAEYRGPARANPARAYESSSQRERYEHRVDAQRSRAIKEAGRHIGELVRDEHWHAVVLAGDPRVTQELAHQLPAPYIVHKHLPAWESAGQLVNDLRPELEDARQRPAAMLAARAHVDAGSYAAGSEAVRAAIATGRAGVVIVDERADDRDTPETVRLALAHELDVHFIDAGPGLVDAVICTLHGVKDTRAA